MLLHIERQGSDHFSKIKFLVIITARECELVFSHSVNSSFDSVGSTWVDLETLENDNSTASEKTTVITA